MLAFVADTPMQRQRTHTTLAKVNHIEPATGEVVANDAEVQYVLPIVTRDMCDKGKRPF